MASFSINIAEIWSNEEVGGVMGGCMFLPARNLCRSLHPVTKALIKVGMSTIVGTLDTGFDWAVLIDWYSKGDSWLLASSLLGSILMSGVLFTICALFELFGGEIPDEIDVQPSEQLRRWKHVLLLPFLLGFGNIIVSSMVIFPEEIDLGLYYQFQLGRTFEIFVEAAPGGGLQLYDLIMSGTLGDWTKLSSYSIIISIISIAFGTEEAVGQALPSIDRVLLYLFSAADFIFRISSISYFLKSYPSMKPYLLPAIVMYEMIPWIMALKKAYKLPACIHIYEGHFFVYLKVVFFAFAGSISSTCVAGAHLVFPGYDHIRDNFQVYFVIRFVISSLLAIWTLMHNTDVLFVTLISVTGIISFCFSWRINWLLKKHGKDLCLNKEVLLDKVDMKSYFWHNVESRNMQRVAFALKNVIDANQPISSPKDAEVIHLLPYFSEKGDKEMVQLLLDNRADIEKRIYHGSTALIMASENGYHNIANILIAAKANIEAQSGWGFTALLSASDRGDELIVNELIGAGANVDHQCKLGRTALFYALEGDHGSIVNALIAAGANFELENLANALIAAGANFELENQNEIGYTSLLRASERGYESVVNELITAGANIDHQSNDGYTALLCAVHEGYGSIVNALIAAGANFELENKYGYTPLILASKRGKESIVNELIAAGANVDHKCGVGFTALLYASDRGYELIVNELIAAGANVNHQSKEGYTALHCASKRGYKAIVDTLIAARANPELEAQDGMLLTPL